MDSRNTLFQLPLCCNNLSNALKWLRKGHAHSYINFMYACICFLCSDDLGKEIISRFSTNLDSNKTWYTDANGRAMQQRM